MTRALIALALFLALGCSGPDDMNFQRPGQPGQPARPLILTRMWGTEQQIGTGQLSPTGFNVQQLVRVENSKAGVQAWNVYMSLVTERPTPAPMIINAEFTIVFGVGKSTSLRKMSLTYDAAAVTVTDDFRNVIANYGEIYKVIQIPAATINIGCIVTKPFSGNDHPVSVAAFAAPVVLEPGTTTE